MKRKKTNRRPTNRNFLYLLFLIFALPLAVWSVQQTKNYISRGQTSSQAVSDSKLGIFALGISDGAKKIVMAGPRVIKVMDPQSNQAAMQLVRDYKRAYPSGIVIMRVYEGASDLHYGLADDPEQAAEDFWNRGLKPAVNKLSPADRRLIDYLSGTNGNENTPDIDESDEAAGWFGRFWARLADLISQSGIKPNVGEIYVWHPQPEHLEAFLPALQKVKETGGIWSIHGYTIDYTTDPQTEINTSLRYRMLNDWLTSHHPEAAGLPMVLTEGGVDKQGNPKTDGWQARGSSEQYRNWLTWYDGELKKDSYVRGVTLFQAGDGNWSSFNLDPLAGWLSDYLRGGRSIIIPTETNLSPSITQISQPTVFTPPTQIPNIIISPTPTPIRTETKPKTPPPPVIIYQTKKILTLPLATPTLIPTATSIPFGKQVQQTHWSDFLGYWENILRRYLP